MKYRDPVTGEFKELYTKAADTLPVGTVVDYDGTEVPAGWEEVENGTVLYENSSGSNGNITLSETSANFKYLEVFYQISGWGTKSIRVESGKGIQLEIMSFDINDWGNIGYIQNIKVMNVSGENLSIHIHRRIFFYPNYTKPAEDDSNNIYITKVIGYK